MFRLAYLEVFSNIFELRKHNLFISLSSETKISLLNILTNFAAAVAAGFPLLLLLFSLLLLLALFSLLLLRRLLLGLRPLCLCAVQLTHFIFYPKQTLTVFTSVSLLPFFEIFYTLLSSPYIHHLTMSRIQI